MHALVAGVGAYTYLKGGVRPSAGWPGEYLGQLTSPPRSAEAVGRWLLRMQTTDPVKPLGSLEMVVSPSLRLVTGPDDGARVDVEVEAATLNRLQKSLDRWYKRCDSNQENVALFYFAGHGIQTDTLTLLMEDAGKNRLRFFDQAFDFNGLYESMAWCGAEVQCYFVDACRTRPEQDKWRKVKPRQLIHAEFKILYRDAPMIFSTVEGQAAYGRRGECTEFTTALLEALDRCGAERSMHEGTWQVTTESIGKAIRALLERGSQLPALFQNDGSARGGAIRTLLGDPLVPFRLSCRPEDALAVASMQLIEDATGQVGAVRGTPERRAWADEIRADKYKFEAVFANSRFHLDKEPIWMQPPFVDRNFAVE
jgi:hypothetical protein